MRVLVALFVTCMTTVSVQARDLVEDLSDAMRLQEVMLILRDEGIMYGRALDQDFLGGSGGQFFERQIAQTYAPGRMLDSMQQAFDEG